KDKLGVDQQRQVIQPAKAWIGRQEGDGQTEIEGEQEAQHSHLAGGQAKHQKDSDHRLPDGLRHSEEEPVGCHDERQELVQARIATLATSADRTAPGRACQARIASGTAASAGPPNSKRRWRPGSRASPPVTWKAGRLASAKASCQERIIKSPWPPNPTSTTRCMPSCARRATGKMTRARRKAFIAGP